MVGSEKLWVRGVTYGTFRPVDGHGYPDAPVVDRDFSMMAAGGFNAVRVYTVPPRWLLDLAAQHDLHVMVGIPWEQHIAFLDDRHRARDIERRVRSAMHEIAGHPALLTVAIGNEIPAPIVRWHGATAISRFLHRLYETAKAEDPDALVTYVNYPTTEYLELPFLDVVTFNVYLETPARFSTYLARLHNVAGDRPLLMGEIGLDSLRNGEAGQARSLDWQLRAAFGAGVSGAFVFAWTDEWHRGGHDIEDWAFGLTRRDRTPKPALAVVTDALAEVPFAKDGDWPMISVVVCSYNGARLIADCLEGLGRVEYPHFEVIVVDDGSKDATASIARAYGVRVISTPNQGLGAARNVGLAAATGDIVAYTDDDARPDPHWLTYLARVFMTTTHAAVGGPNIAPPGDGAIASCVANAPGGPVHVLVSDTQAEHIPGCNMAFRKSALESIGGFDPRFRRAGDDVDVCWRLLDQGLTIGFSPGAMVWHHRRNSLRTYVKQQLGYGEAEALLEAKWPEKYNAAGHVSWAGRLYGKGLTRALTRRARIYHGTWGQALFQSVYEPAAPGFASLLLMPEWYLALLVLAALALLGASWPPLLLAVPLLVAGVAGSITQAALSAMHAHLLEPPPSRLAAAGLRVITATLHLVQPLARLRGRLRHGLTVWRRRGPPDLAWPGARAWRLWFERGAGYDVRLRALERALRARGAVVLRGGDFERWDFEVRGGTFGRVRVATTTEEHGGGRQLMRVRCVPRAAVGTWLVAVPAVLAGLAAAMLSAAAILVGVRVIVDTGAATAAVTEAVGELAEPEA
jgi:GT2 family glycosyltransferase/membrane protein implicated in regulation of membrane protease activity